MSRPSSRASELISQLSTSLEISPSRYDAAERSYKSIGAWLSRPDSALANMDVKVYLQGSFRLGTAIKPVSGEENYDLDIVCEVAIDKLSLTQQKLQDRLGDELKSYCRSHGMEAPIRWRRCWVINYADEARFHIDFLPAIPDGASQIRRLAELRYATSTYAGKSIAITDSKHDNFRIVSPDWPVSNPNGYADWFLDRMSFPVRLDERELAKGKTEVADIPVFRRHTPLQSAIKILKRHRDQMFIDDIESKPSSVVITTLCAYAYAKEATPLEAILGILERLPSHIKVASDGSPQIYNPSDLRENFADLWKDYPKKKEAFFEWYEVAKTDFTTAARLDDNYQLVESLGPRLGRTLVESFVHESHGNALVVKSQAHVPSIITNASHKQALRWPLNEIESLRFLRVSKTRAGFRTREIRSGENISPETSLRFHAQTTAKHPFKTFWQIVNTGDVARAKNQLRGNFDEGEFEEGRLIRDEVARYPGVHSIQCFVVKGGVCVARSPIFIVKID